MKRRLNWHLPLIATIPSLIFILVLACGDGGKDKLGSAATSRPAIVPTWTPVTDLSSSSEAHETGLEVEDIQLEPGEYGGKLTITLFNASDEACLGPIVNFALLREDKSVATNMGLPSGGALEAGARTQLNQRYVGMAVVELAVTRLSCDNVIGSN